MIPSHASLPVAAIDAAMGRATSGWVMAPLDPKVVLESERRSHLWLRDFQDQRFLGPQPWDVKP